ncbi:hypothetical protein Nepgr_004062 [Nepenthes gracilis]|uniref:WW domain-containing protein n=1 Tax=Nepenthes gracilis TaxID=150966 RepID=A0AAD3S0R4_NEPGR|nr:hypothetical protein Nepgr_004062 [Nepenthes gracilis]
MSSPNMETLTASLERSLQSCSLNQSSGADGEIGQSSSSNAPRDRPPLSNSDSNSNSSCSDTTLVELNSHISLPYQWEQCLDLKTGDIYYINWRTGMKAKEDPRLTGDNYSGDYYYYSEEDDSEGSSTESSASSPREDFRGAGEEGEGQRQNDVLVVGGCKSCLMYFMVPKHVEDCPKCNAHLLHFDPSDNASL